MKKFMAIMLALVLALGMTSTAFAATITIPSDSTDDQNSIGEVYTAYKIFDVTKLTSTTTSGEGDDATTTTTTTGWAYTLDAESDWAEVLVNNEKQTWLDLTISADGDEYTVKLKANVANNETTAKEIAAFLLANKGDITGTVLSTETTTVEDGYYLITSSLGANLGLATTDFGINITEKNTYPVINKTVTQETVAIGETVNYEIVVTVPSTIDKAVTVHDKMEAGLTLNADSIKVYTRETVEEAAVDTEVSATETVEEETVTNYTMETSAEDGCAFEIGITTALAGETVVIKYTAEMDKDAEIADETEAEADKEDGIATDGTNSNRAWLTYSNFKSTEITVSTKVYEFDLKKVNGVKEQLTGATFELYDSLTAGNKIKLVKDGTNNIYRVADDTEVVATGFESAVIQAGQAHIEGLNGNTTYYLEELTAPTGYNPLTERKAVTLNKTNLTGTSAVEVVNNTGSELPSTGGMGTTIFYVVGGMMMAAAFVLLITKRKVASEK